MVLSVNLYQSCESLTTLYVTGFTGERHSTLVISQPLIRRIGGSVEVVIVESKHQFL